MKKVLRILCLFMIVVTLFGCNKEDESSLKEDYKQIEGELSMHKAGKEDILAMYNHGTGVVFLSWVDCPWCQRYIKYLNNVARDNGIDVLYYDIYEDRDKNTAFYQEVITIIQDELEKSGAFDSDGKYRIYIPDVCFVIDGKIIYHDNQTSMFDNDDVDAYWTKEKENELCQILDEKMKLVRERKDEIDKQGCDEEAACQVKK